MELFLPAVVLVWAAIMLGRTWEAHQRDRNHKQLVVIQKLLPAPPAKGDCGSSGPCHRCGIRLVRDISTWCHECRMSLQQLR